MGGINQLARRIPDWALWVAGLLPLAWLVWGVLANELGPDPVKVVEHRLGVLGLQFLIASLCITPLRWVGVNLYRFRRTLGLLAFTYVTLHFTAWVALDLAFRWSEIGADLVKRPYIILGMIGFAAMIPLAVTSTKTAIRRMGALAWGRLHKLAYLAAGAGALHYLVLVKAWPLEPMLYLAVVATLLGLRAARSWGMPQRATA